MTRSFYSSNHAPYYIYALDYIQQSAGIRALHYLCHALNESGYEAYVTCKVTAPHLRTPVLSKKIMQRHQASGREPIVVYPEIVHGNPLAGNTVARWLLNQPGHLAGDKYFSDDDLIFTFDPSYLPAEMRGEVLHIPTIDLSIFNNEENPDDDSREYICFYAKKYLSKGGKFTRHVEGGISLCQDQKLTHRDIASILRKSKLLYVYEPTALIGEALLCGCPVSIIETDYWKANTANYSYVADWGVVMDDSPESLALAKANVENYRAFHEGVVIRDAWIHLDRFIKLTQEAVGRGESSAIFDSAAGLLPGKTEDRSGYDNWREARAGDSLFELADTGATELAGQASHFHLVACVPNASESEIVEMHRSVMHQKHSHWTLTIVSQMPMPQRMELSGRVRWHQSSGASIYEEVNRLASEDVSSDFLVFLDAGSSLEPHALMSIALRFDKYPAWCLAFADEDELRPGGEFVNPYFKSDFEPDRLRAMPFLAEGLLAIRRSSFMELQGFSANSPGAEKYDLLLRAYEKFGGGGLGHISELLSHRRVDEQGAGATSAALNEARLSGLRAHLARMGTMADIESGLLPDTFHLRYQHGGETAVSIIIPTMNGGAALKNSVNGIVANTEYKNWELVVVDQESDEPETLEFLAYLRAFENDAIRVITQPRAASFPAALNAGAKVARQDMLLFLSDSTQPLRGDWLDEMLGYAVQPGVGVVGAKGVGLDGTVSNAGYILGLEGRPAGFPEQHVALDAPGYFGRLQVPGNPSAVSFTCMLTEKKLFDELGGFDDQSLVGGYSDVDYCLKVGAAGQRMVWTPFAVVFQKHQAEAPEALTSDDEDDDCEQERSWILPGPAGQTMFDRWLDRIAFDPAYNRNLSLCQHSAKDHVNGFEIESMTALTLDPDFRPVPRILALRGDFSGCAESRIVAPLRALTGRVQSLEITTYLSIPELARMSPDAIVFQRQINEEQVRLMALYARNTKAFRVYELDDLITNIQLRNRSRRDFQDADLVKRFRQALDTCDRMVVATETLAEEYRKFNADIRVVPNYVEQAKWGGLLPKRRRGRKPRVGWAGSNSHEGDLAIVAEVVKALADEVEWVFFGLCPEGVRPLVEYHSGVPVEHFPVKLASLDLDLAIAPLEDVPFNHAKSHLKLLEYGILGYPVICTDITPYRGDYPVTRVKSRQKDWVAAIREHISDMDELARRGDVLRDYIKANWLLEDHADSWLKAWLPG